MYHHIPSFFFYTHPTTTPSYTLSLHDALPIFQSWAVINMAVAFALIAAASVRAALALLLLLAYFAGYPALQRERSEEHTSELQSRVDLVLRLLLETKK